MKLILLLLLCSYLMFLRCSTEIQLNTIPIIDTTVVYGLLDRSDTAQYVRITRSFGLNLDPATNMLDTPVLFFDSLVVFLIGSSDSIQLVKTDVSKEVTSGNSIFASLAPNYYYKTKEPLNEDFYSLLIVNPAKNYLVTSGTSMVADFSVSGLASNSQLNLVSGSYYDFSWNESSFAAVFQLAMRVFYSESTSGNPSQIKYFDWNLTQVSAFSDTAYAEYKLYGDYFFSVMKNNLIVDESAIRKFDHLEFYVTQAGATVDSSISIFKAQAGLTSGYVLPLYTNVSNGLGIFDSRYTKKFLQIQLSAGALDDLACNSQTKSLRFLNSTGVLCP